MTWYYYEIRKEIAGVIEVISIEGKLLVAKQVVRTSGFGHYLWFKLIPGDYHFLNNYTVFRPATEEEVNHFKAQYLLQQI